MLVAITLLSAFLLDEWFGLIAFRAGGYNLRPTGEAFRLLTKTP
jgi:hypothetical protein